MIKKFLMLSLIAATAISCTDYKKQQDELIETKWRLETLNGNTDLQMSDKDSFTLEFDPIELRAFGKADCNRYFATYELDEEDELEFVTPGASMMMCPNDKLERGYLTTLERVENFKIKDGKLYLLDDDKELAVFVKETSNI